MCSDISIQLAECKHQSRAVTAVNWGDLREVHALVDVSQIRKHTKLDIFLLTCDPIFCLKLLSRVNLGCIFL